MDSVFTAITQFMCLGSLVLCILVLQKAHASWLQISVVGIGLIVGPCGVLFLAQQVSTQGFNHLWINLGCILGTGGIAFYAGEKFNDTLQSTDLRYVGVELIIPLLPSLNATLPLSGNSSMSESIAGYTAFILGTTLYFMFGCAGFSGYWNRPEESRSLMKESSVEDASKAEDKNDFKK